MSILIKGMSLPEEGYHHIVCIYSNGVVDARVSNWVAVEVPPHGRLIDADAFAAKIIEIIERQGYDDFYAQSLSVGEILRSVVHELKGDGIDGFSNAPTIIEAEVEE